MSDAFRNSVPDDFNNYDPRPSVWEAEPIPNSTRYAFSGKILLSSVVILFLVILLIASLHLYVRWYVLRVRRRNRRRRTHFVFYVEPHTAAAASRGLDPAIIDSLPVFAYKPSEAAMMDCAVCLSEFEANESGLRLPKCGHAFHVECINMWFQSHSNCPLCRAVVENSSSHSCPVSNDSSSSSLAISNEETGNSKVTEVENVSTEIPGVSSLDCELPSPATKTPVSGRMRSLRRILSRAALSPTATTCVSESHEELDAMERGETPRPVGE